MIPIGTITPFGEVVGIIWLGVRYYFLTKNGVVSLLPADVVEPKP